MNSWSGGASVIVEGLGTGPPGPPKSDPGNNSGFAQVLATAQPGMSLSVTIGTYRPTLYRPVPPLLSPTSASENRDPSRTQPSYEHQSITYPTRNSSSSSSRIIINAVYDDI